MESAAKTASASAGGTSPSMPCHFSSRSSGQFASRSVPCQRSRSRCQSTGWPTAMPPSVNRPPWIELSAFVDEEEVHQRGRVGRPTARRPPPRVCLPLERLGRGDPLRLAGGCRRWEGGIRLGADAPEVEPVGVPADRDRGVVAQLAAGVLVAGVDQEVGLRHRGEVMDAVQLVCSCAPRRRGRGRRRRAPASSRGTTRRGRRPRGRLLESRGRAWRRPGRRAASGARRGGGTRARYCARVRRRPARRGRGSPAPVNRDAFGTERSPTRDYFSGLPESWDSPGS